MHSRVNIVLAAAVFALMVVLGVVLTGSMRTCYADGFSGPAWVAREHEQSDGYYCDAPWWENLYPWHWGAEDVCIGCLELQ